MSIPPLIPRRVLFNNPDHASVQLSQDGHYLAYLAPLEGVLNIWYYTVNDPTPIPLTHDTHRGIRAYGWCEDHIIYLQDQGGDENWQLFKINITTKHITCLTKAGVHAQIIASSPDHPHHVIIRLNDRHAELHDYYRLDISTGQKTLILENPGYGGVVFDNNLALRFAMEIQPDGGLKLLSFRNNTWHPYDIIGPEDALTTSIIGFTKDNESMYMLDSRTSDTSVLKCIHIQTKEETILATDARADGADFLMHPLHKTPQAYGVNYLRKTWQFFDSDFEKDFHFLKTITQGDIEIVSRTLDDITWIVAFMKDDAPVAYYLFNRTQQKATFLFYNRSDLKKYNLQPMEAFEIKTRDGLTMPCYMTKATPFPGPLVLNIHGGPRARDTWGYDPLHQWLANRGYSVMSINYRGSMGFGKDFMNKGNGEWGRAMHEDIIDAAEWAIENGFAKRNEIAIMGGSYGGYATLVGLTSTPDYFACGVDLVGVSNLETFVTSIPPYWRPVRDVLKVMLGVDFELELAKDFLRERSPLTHCHRITKPLLIGHGANDPRVKQAESDQIVKALLDKNIPVIYLVYPDEGHGFARAPNRLSFYAITEAFLAKVLKGRCEPLPLDFEDSSLEIMAGKEYIKDLEIKV